MSSLPASQPQKGWYLCILSLDSLWYSHQFIGLCGQWDVDHTDRDSHGVGSCIQKYPHCIWVNLCGWQGVDCVDRVSHGVDLCGQRHADCMERNRHGVGSCAQSIPIVYESICVDGEVWIVQIGTVMGLICVDGNMQIVWRGTDMGLVHAPRVSLFSELYMGLICVEGNKHLNCRRQNKIIGKKQVTDNPKEMK